MRGAGITELYRYSVRWRFVALILGLGLAACTTSSREGAGGGHEMAHDAPVPFAVRDDAEGLFLIWLDAEGAHTATSRDEIPESARDMVRVDDLSLGPDERPDPGVVFVADLREAGADGTYPARRVAREDFEARLVALRPAPTPPAEAVPSADASVVVYGASWCSACRQTAAYLRSRNVAFVERDIEREPGAREAMMAAASAAGIRPQGIPVIDFNGRIIRGFNQGALDREIARTASTL